MNEKRPRQYASEILEKVGDEIKKVPFEHRETVISYLKQAMVKRAHEGLIQSGGNHENRTR